jgi:PTEN phosphatase family protein
MFGERRTDLEKGDKFQGVETPSQSRFVGYYEKMLKNYNGELPPKVSLKLNKIIITSIKGKER